VNDAVRRVREVLAAHGVDDTVQTFDEPVPSAASAAARIGCEVGAIANSLLFSVDGAPLLVLASGAHRVDTGKLARHRGVGREKVSATAVARTAEHAADAGVGDRVRAERHDLAVSRPEGAYDLVSRRPP